MYKKIIDTSTYNGVVDFAKAKAQGVDGAIIKIIRKDLNKDNQFDNSYKNCEKVGMPWGVYNYSYAKTVAKAKSDMNLVCDILDKVSKKYFTYGVWFDLEDHSQESLSKTAIANILNAAQDVVESRGYKFGIYTGKDYYKENIDASKVKCTNWWIARYYKGTTKMNISENPDNKVKPEMCTFAWQYTEKGRFNPAISSGNGSNVDLSIVYKDMNGKAAQETVTTKVESTTTTVKKEETKKSEYSKELKYKATVYNCTYLNVRTGPAKQNSACTFSPLKCKEVIEVCDETKDTSGKTWCYIRKKVKGTYKYGFCSKAYLKKV